ncbi:MAG: DUF1998 domain-containing protein, partial [Candidatus Latescibacteria bacterium]|nr:DUF1998 domain-containing protein [Candidatus Latescibacterota bacterium]
IHAVTLSEFWKKRPDLFGNADLFFFPPAQSAPEELKAFLNERPQSLKQALLRIVPQDIQPVFGIHNWLWIEELSGDVKGSLSKASEEIRSDVQELERVRKDLSDQHKPSDYILRTIRTLKKRDVIGYLSTRNVLPKYGFPVDVVGLEIMHHGEEAKRLELQRDLRIAISEYAPESEVVAGGRLWVSYGLKRLPKRDWIRYRYAICPECGRYQREIEGKQSPPKICCTCGSSLDRRGAKGRFLVPEFGFVTGHKEPKRPGESRPQRTYTTRAYFSGEFFQEERTCESVLGPITFTAVSYREGRMAVLNRTGFKICYRCGFAVRLYTKTPSHHETSWGRKCPGKLSSPISLGHEFRTDILDLRMEGYSKPDESFRLSLLYALLEGISESLEISRDDIDGCLFRDAQGQAFILFDNVPGGAGHVKRLTESSNTLREMLRSALKKVSGTCGCGEETSCYGCLRNYRNQFCHDQLKRGKVREFLESLPLWEGE